MKAVYIAEHGGINNLIYGELPEPEPQEGEVLVQVRACGVNRGDLRVREGLPFIRLRLPHVLGGDIAGEVVAVAPALREMAVGTRVLLNPRISCRCCAYCLAGRDHLCSHCEIVGVQLPGGYAEYVKVPRANVVPLPEGITWEAAACVPVVYTTAWNMVVEQAKLQPGEWILVHAAGSGVGSAAIQLARLVGANIITTAGSDEKLAKAQALGAHHGINYHKQDFLREVRRITEKRGVDVVIEHIGAETWERSLHCLTRGGRLVSCGASSGYPEKTDLRYVFSRYLRILGTELGGKASLFTIIRLVQEGKLQPVLDRVLPLREAREAHRLLEARQQFGKLVLMPI